MNPDKLETLRQKLSELLKKPVAPMKFTDDELKKMKEEEDVDWDRYGNRIVAIEDFPDALLVDRKAYQITKQEYDKLIEKGRETLGCLSSGFSESSALAIMELAYNLRDAGGEQVFAQIPAVDCSASTDALSRRPINSSGTNVIVSTDGVETVEDKKCLANFFCFIAASTLRLFSKSSRNYLKAWAHIIRGYMKFYHREVPVILQTPTSVGIESLMEIFRNSRVFKNTLYHMLYHRNLAVPEGFRSSVFEMHLAFTGLHFPSIFLRLQQALGCPPSYIIDAIQGAETEKAIKLMRKVLSMANSGDEKYKRSMWKFGRLFEQKFLVGLQTKRCIIPCYSLASALRQVEASSTASIMEIAQFQELSQERKHKLNLVGTEIVRRIKAAIENENMQNNPQ